MAYGTDVLPALIWSAIDATALGDNTVIAAVAGSRIRVIAMWFSTTVAINMQFKSGANVLVPPFSVAASSLTVLDTCENGWIAQTNVGEAFVLNHSLASSTRGALMYVLA